MLCRKANVANACVRLVIRAIEIVGGQGFYLSFGLARFFRDLQAARYHPLPEPEQQRFLGEYVLGQRPSARSQVQAVSDRVTA